MRYGLPVEDVAMLALARFCTHNGCGLRRVVIQGLWRRALDHGEIRSFGCGVAADQAAIAKQSARGSASGRSARAERHFLRSAHRLSVARFAGAVWTVHDGLQSFQSLGQGRHLAQDIRGIRGKIATIASADRFLDRARPPTRRRRKKGGEDHAIGRSRGGLSTKIHAVVGNHGLPLRLLLTAGQTHDQRAVEPLLATLPPNADVVGDRAYDSNRVLSIIERAGARANIPTDARRLVQRSVDRDLYRKRNLIERFFCKLKHFRRIATRFDKLARNFLAAVMLASTRLWIRAYESTT